ncbi:RNA methyltransferase [Bacteroidota bacterium]
MRKLKLDELGRISVEDYKKSTKIPITVILDDIRSLNNIGSVFRTADAFRIEAIHLCGITACPPHREIHKTALGATDSVSWKYYENVISSVKELKDNGYVICGIEQTTKSIDIEDFDMHKKQKTAIIFGNEVSGINNSILGMLDHCVEIPQFGTKHSLNISVCAGIVLWEVFKKFRINID